jgi:hypothetical protein
MGKAFATMMLISSASCAFNLDNQRLSKSFSCKTNKCCYSIDTETITQVCGGASTQELTIIIVRHN